ERQSLYVFPDLVQVDPERASHEPHLPAPHHGRHTGRHHGWQLVHGLPHTHQVADGIGLVVGRIVEDLLAAHHIDHAAETADQHRQDVVAPAGVYAGDEQGSATGFDGSQYRFPDFR